MVETAADYQWSSASAHAAGSDAAGLLDKGWQRAAGVGAEWTGFLHEAAGDVELEKCTYAGRPFGDADFVARVGARCGRRWDRGRPKKEAQPAPGPETASGSLFAE